MPRMNHRERVMAAIRHEVPDRIPVDAICIENADALARLLSVPVEAVYDRLSIDGRCVAAYRYTGELPVRDGKVLSPWGTEEGNDYGTAHFYPLAAASSVAEVDRYPWPDAGLFNFEELRSSLKTWTREYALRGPYWISGPLFCTTCNLLGMEETLVKMLAEPEIVEACLEQVFHFSSTYVERFIGSSSSRTTPGSLPSARRRGCPSGSIPVATSPPCCRT